MLRPRLFQRLDELREASVTWITGPPGCGKTSLASSYLAERHISGPWLQLDGDDADLATFFHYLGRAVQLAAVRGGPDLPTLMPQSIPNVLSFTRRYAQAIAARVDRPAVIVFDNYDHVGTETPLHEVVRELASYLPEGLSLLVLSRVEPPAAFARMRLHQSLRLLEGEELNLTRDEALALFNAQKPESGFSPEQDGHLDELLLETRGWFAGFTLLLAERSLSNAKRAVLRGKTQQLLFDYFAAELFGTIDPSTQDALLRTAALPTMTVADAVRISGDANVGRTLMELHRRNCFVVQRGPDEPVYEYHALFRAFLLNRVASSLSPDEWRDLQCRSAALLAQGGQTEAAAALYRSAGDWQALSTLAQREAPALIAAGRHRMLENWLIDLPDDLFVSTPWLSHWRAVARLPFDPVSARASFEQAYAGFQRDNDVVGLYATWAGAMESFFFEWRDFRLADPWISEFEALRTLHPVYPSRAVELRTYWAMGTLLHRQPQHPMLPAWAERAKALLDPTDRDLSVLLGGYLIIWFLWRGEAAEARTIIHRITPWTAPAMSPMVLILWSCATGLYHSVRGEVAQCRHSIETGLGVADQADLHAFDFLLTAQMARCSLVAGDPVAADGWMARMAPAMRHHSHIDGAFYQYLQCSAAAQRASWQLALDHGRGSLAMAIESGVPFVMATSHIALARALLERGSDPEWTEHIDAARAIGQAMNSQVIEYLCLELESRAALKRGDCEVVAQRLSSAMVLSAAMDGATWHVAGPQANSELYQYALSTGIEVEHVQRMIRRFHIAPPEAATAADTWPWPIRIHSLGGFELLCDDQPLRAAGKSQHRPLELLKCLLALGGHAVSQDRLTDALWPDAEGDAADQALRTTLHRLRKLLRHEHAVRLQDRQLSLDTDWVWADCLVFDQAAHLPPSNDVTWLRSALRRYRGPFLDGESMHWALAFRERLRSQFKRMAERLGDLLERDGDWQGAVDAYLEAIDVEPLAEGLHRRLMCAYEHLGRRSEVVATYQRCRQALLAQQGVSPALETQALYRQLADR
ncbi:BTAD domain-containing putative transcriptional regulator [Variovorax rhizosphaerae]|uniref:BTAD domain-containing putative transcriptional regulator n=1 Tax=Variovorax rhizosphaerae TaxID=1836200 RepID=A0ABU8WPM8_9BURK